MPEILEVEASRRLLEARALRRRIEVVDAPDPWVLKHGLTEPVLRDALVGRRLERARRHGKHLLLDTSRHGPTLGIHFGMTGRVYVDGEPAIEHLRWGSNVPDPAWDRLTLHLAGGTEVLIRDPRRLGAVELDPDTSRLGPDALSLTEVELDGALDRHRAPVKALLLDQARVAGLGNLLVDEILWRAGIDPARGAGGLDAAERRALLRSTRQALRTLGRRGGSHTGDLMPARVDGGLCPRDGTPLVRRTVGGRTTFSCPAHQH